MKTQKAIRESFMELRKDLPLAKIKVKAICDMAMINKSTFYKYYEDVYDLSDKLENELIEEMLRVNEEELILENPEGFLDSIHNILVTKNAEIDVLFQDRQEILLAKFNKRLCADLFKEGRENAALATTFVLGGLVFTNLSRRENNVEYSENMRDDLLRYIKAVGSCLEP